MNDFFIYYDYKMNDYTKIISAFAIIAGVVLCSTYKETFIVHKMSNVKTLCKEKQNALKNTQLVEPTSIDDVENVTNTQICPEPDCASGKGNPKYLYHPSTLKEVRTIIKSQNFGKTIKVSGSYTHKDVSYTKDVIIRTLNLNKVLKTNTDKMTVTVESGMLVKDLYDHLDKHSLGLSVIIPNGWKSIGSAICLSDHGSNIDEGTICSLVKDIAVMHADGSLKTYTKNDEEFRAIIGGVGGIAFIYGITLQCVPAYNVKETLLHTTWSHVCANLNNYLDENKYLEVTINPYTQKVILQLRKHISKDSLIDIVSLVKPSYKALSGKVKSDQCAEFGVDYAHYSSAVADVLAIIQFSNDINVKVCLRFSGNDKDSMLSMASGRDFTCWIEVTGACDELLKNIEEQLIAKFDGRPSYGKKNTLHEQLMIKLYSDNFHEFQHVRNKLDSERIFTNDYLRERIGE